MHATCEKIAIYASLESFLRRALVVIEAVALVWKYVRFVKSQSGSDFGFNSGFKVRSIILPTCRGLVLYQFYKTRTFRPLGSAIQGYKSIYCLAIYCSNILILTISVSILVFI